MSGLRLLLAPVFIWLYFRPGWGAAVIFALCGLTDLLDGYLARRWDARSDLGRVLDPLSDKVLTVSALACFAVSGRLNRALAAVMICTELLILFGGVCLLCLSVVPQAQFAGKAAAAAITVAVWSGLLFPAWQGLRYFMFVSLTLTAFALGTYALQTLKILGMFLTMDKKKI
ncbi:MAG: CDP-alcohol phosphatidyltransferase family protein [Clostridia bacterium]|nr:CDP-alcohol phosphatidyltransferase family protein [Clostridia bacterium]